MRREGSSKRDPVAIANISGFYGDRLSALSEVLSSQDDIDFITGDYLAELTMYILAKQMNRDPSKGYAASFLKQLSDSIDQIFRRGIKVVVNAGGLNPAGLAKEVEYLVRSRSLDLKVAYLEGDNVLEQLISASQRGVSIRNIDTDKEVDFLSQKPVSANAYLGAFEIAAAFELGADIVICPRVTDASLVVGPSIYYYGWEREELDKLAGAVVAGHILECGTQCTGGNYSLISELPKTSLPGFPIAKIFQDGSCEISKVSGSGGVVSIGTITEQLLYEIGSPRYINPDVVAHFDTISLTQTAKDVVRVEGAKGSEPPNTYKVALNFFGGYRNHVMFAFTGLNIVEKTEMIKNQMMDDKTVDAPDEMSFQLIGDPSSNILYQEGSTCLMRVSVKDSDRAKVGRAFSNAAVELALASYPGLYLANPPQEASEFAIYVPTLVDKSSVAVTVNLFRDNDVTSYQYQGATFKDVGVRRIQDPIQYGSSQISAEKVQTVGSCCNVFENSFENLPIGVICGARSGDKGGNANLGVWTWDDHLYRFLLGLLTEKSLVELMPELTPYHVLRHEFSNLRALNFVVVGLLGEGVSSTLRFDAQAKGLAEFFRSRSVPLPRHISERGIVKKRS